MTSAPGVKAYFLTLGCSKNDADSRGLMRGLVAAGVEVVADPEGATHIIVNTCGFIQDAKEESIAAILEVCEEYPDKKVLAIGCLVERYQKELADGMPEVSGWLGVLAADTGERLLKEILGDRSVGHGLTAGDTPGAKAYAYLKVSDGCDEGCTFCAIPGIKGAYVSLSTEEILREADVCLSEGARELVLVGQDTTRWKSEGLDLRGLIDVLASDRRVRRIRVMYLQPTRVDEEFMVFMAEHAKLCKYLDVPFQHSHKEILRRMGRRGDADSYMHLLRRAREMMPSVAARSTFIVGFPGETERHFEHLLDFVQRAEFDYGGAFIYSPEEGTVAARLGPVVERATSQRRFNSLNRALLELGEVRREGLVGAECEVIIDCADADEFIEGAGAVGRTEGQAPEVDGVTYVMGTGASGLVPGDIVRVKMTEVLGCDLVGEICEA